MSQTVTVLASTAKAGKAGDDLVDTAFALVFQRVLQDRMFGIVGFGAGNRVTLEGACPQIASTLSLDENLVMEWLGSVDVNEDEHVDKDEVKEHLNQRYVLASCRSHAVGVVWDAVLSRELVGTFRQLAGHPPLDDAPTSFDDFVNAYKDVTGNYSEDDLREVTTTIRKDNGGTGEITPYQLTDYFRRSLRGEYQTGQGSKASKSRAGDVHSKFVSKVFELELARRIRGVAGQDPASEEDIRGDNFVEGFVANYDWTVEGAWTAFNAIDLDQSKEVESYELNVAVDGFVAGFIYGLE